MADDVVLYEASGNWMVLLLVAVGVLGPVTLIGIGVSIRARFRQQMLWSARVLASFLVAASVLPGIAGVMGWWSGSRTVARTVELADPAVRSLIQAAGDVETQIPLTVGALATVLLLPPAVLALLIALPKARGQA